MAIQPTVFGTFGFHTRNTVPYTSETMFASNDGTDAKTCALFLGLLNALGYIPVIGLIPGIVSLYPLMDKTSSMHEEPTNVKTAHYVRGVFACLGLGALYLIPDLICTAIRFHPSTYFGRISYWHTPFGKEYSGRFGIIIGRSFKDVQHLLPEGSLPAFRSGWNK